MKSFKYLIFLITFVSNMVFAINAMQIIKRIDLNNNIKTLEYTGIMEIHKNNIIFSKKFKVYISGNEKFFIKFINPEDEGVKYLKIKNQLWIAEDEDIVKISGHLLKNSMMGSDFSYEDSMSKNKLEELYTAKILKEEKWNDKDCYIIELNAKKDNAPYKKEILYVDKEKFIALKTEFYGLSGKMLKSLIVLKTEKISDKYIPTKIKMINKIKKNNYTLFEMKNIKINIPIKNSIFTLQYLERE